MDRVQIELLTLIQERMIIMDRVKVLWHRVKLYVESSKYGVHVFL